MKTLHNLLRRQLHRLGLAPGRTPEPATWDEFLRRVSQTYGDADQERYLLERSQDIASREMTGLYESLQQERDTLEARVRERTAALAKSEARFRSFTSLGSDWYWEQDDQFRFTSISGNLENVAGYDTIEHIGCTRWELPGMEPPEGGWDAHRASLEAHETFYDVIFRRKNRDDGHSYSAISGEPLFDPDGRFIGYHGIGRDVTKQKLTEENNVRLAHYDTLTGLFNRAAFFERLNHALSLARRHGCVIAVLFIDLDRFKDVNDAFGHVTGDEVLKLMAERLGDTIRVSDTAARLGGDEFIVLAENVVREQRRRRLRAAPGRRARRAVPAARPGMPAVGQHRHLDVPARRRRRRDAPQEGRHRDVPGQGRRPQQSRILLRTGHAPCRGSHRHGRRHPARTRHRPAAAALPAEGVGAHRSHHGCRGAGALAASRARPAAAGIVHSARRGFRAHPPHRALGAERGVHAGGAVGRPAARTR